MQLPNPVVGFVEFVVFVGVVGFVGFLEMGGPTKSTKHKIRRDGGLRISGYIRFAQYKCRWL
jgi:hypothetical protein